MLRTVLALFALASVPAQATTHNDCRIAYRDCMKKKSPVEECLKIKRDCEAQVRADLKNKKSPAPLAQEKAKPAGESQSTGDSH